VNFAAITLCVASQRVFVVVVVVVVVVVYFVIDSVRKLLDIPSYYLIVSCIQSLSYNFLHSPVTSSPFRQAALFSTFHSDILSLCYSVRSRGHVSHPWRTTGKVIIFRDEIDETL
jgi:hypothetical protein